MTSFDAGAEHFTISERDLASVIGDCAKDVN